MNNKEVLISVRKYKIFGAVMLLLIALFAFVVIRDINSKNAEDFRISNLKAEEREKNACAERDSVRLEISFQTGRIKEMNKELVRSRTILYKIENNYDNSIMQLNKVRNEKDFIPNNVSYDEQYNFISNYKYSEYQMPK